MEKLFRTVSRGGENAPFSDAFALARFNHSISGKVETGDGQGHRRACDISGAHLMRARSNSPGFSAP